MALASVYSASVGNSIHASANQRESQKVGCTGPIKHAMPPSLTTLHICGTDVQTKIGSTIQYLAPSHALHNVKPMNVYGKFGTPIRYIVSSVPVTRASAACKQLPGVAVNASVDHGKSVPSPTLGA